MQEDKKKLSDVDQTTEQEKVDKFLHLEKSIATKRENPFSAVDYEAGPSKKKKKKKNEEESIINTSKFNLTVLSKQF